MRDRQKPQGFLVLRTTELTILAHDFGPCLPLSFFKKNPAFIFIFCYLAVCYLATRHLPCSAAFPLLFERCVASRRALCLLLTPFRAYVTKRSNRWPWRPQQASYGSQHWRLLLLCHHLNKRLKKLGGVGASKMEGVKLLQLKRNPKSRGRWAQSVFLAAPEGGRGNLPPAAFFWPFPGAFSSRTT